MIKIVESVAPKEAAIKIYATFIKRKYNIEKSATWIILKDISKKMGSKSA